jgi:hypothetical protein
VVRAGGRGASRYLAFIEGEGGIRGLGLWDPRSNSTETILTPEQVDVATMQRDQDARLFAVQYVDHYPNWHYPDPEHPLARLHMGLRGTFREDDVEIVSVSRDGRFVVARSHGPQNPGVYHVVDARGLGAVDGGVAAGGAGGVGVARRATI